MNIEYVFDRYKCIDEKVKKRHYFWRQMFVCFTTTQYYFMIGLSLGAPTVVVPQLRKEANSRSAVSEEMASWITAIVPYSSILWILVLITGAHYFGRKKPMIVIAINSLIAFSILFYSKNITHIFLSQLMQGLTQASHTTTSILVVIECTSPVYRGALLSAFSATYFWGVWVANAIGTFYDYRYIGMCGSVCAIYVLITLYFIPESPYWLACQERYDECSKVHRWLKGTGTEAEKELIALINSQICLKKISTETTMSVKAYVYKYANVLRDPQIYKPIGLNFLLNMLYNFCGKLVCAVYAVEIMKKITRTESDAYMGVFILDGFSVAGMYTGSYLAKRFKRRKLLIRSSTLCGVFLYLFSIYLFLVKSSIIMENIFISIGLLIGFTLSACCGPITVTLAIFSESFPVKHRSFTMCIMCVFCKIMLGSMLKVAPLIFKNLGVHGTFLLFAVSFSIVLSFVNKFLPETKDKTLEEIAEIFKKKTKAFI